MITQQELKQYLSYNKDTGIFTWINFINKSNVKKGSIAGYVNNNEYVIIKINQLRYAAHRLAWLYVHGKMPNKYLDHINRNKQDNRIENLRECNNSQNAQNRLNALSINKSGYLGVWSNRNSKKHPYAAGIKINNKSYYLGSFSNALDAHKAYLEAKKKLHEFYVEQ